MPIATALPKNNVTIRFPSQAEPGTQEESYQLLELPPEILKRVEASTSPFPYVFNSWLNHNCFVSVDVILQLDSPSRVDPLTMEFSVHPIAHSSFVLSKSQIPSSSSELPFFQLLLQLLLLLPFPKQLPMLDVVTRHSRSEMSVMRYWSVYLRLPISKGSEPYFDRLNGKV